MSASTVSDLKVDVAANYRETQELGTAITNTLKAQASALVTMINARDAYTLARNNYSDATRAALEAVHAADQVTRRQALQCTLDAYDTARNGIEPGAMPVAVLESFARAIRTPPRDEESI